MYAASKDGSSQHPERSGKVSELCSEHRPDQGSRSRDGGEVMAEYHPFIRYQKVAPVFQAFGRSSAERVESKNLRCDELTVEAVAEGIAAGGGHDQPQCVNRFTAMNGHHGDRHKTKQAH